MNNIFLRMKTLLEQTGIKFTEGGLSQSEIYAYSTGIDLVRRYIAEIISEVFIDSTSGAEKYAALLNIDSSRYTDEALRNEIIRRLSMNFACSTVRELAAAFEAIGSGTYYLYHDGGEVLTSVMFEDIMSSDLAELGKFIESYICMSTRLHFNGNGLDFDTWGLWGQSFYKLDKMGLPFKIIDELRSDRIEQH